MTYEPLHHKYRPQTFAALVGQDPIAITLTHALELGRIAPAYLFAGPRGTGKTSSARILAKSLNCLQHQESTPQPCGVCEVCRAIALGTALDVIEIDAASNTGVDNIRELIERAQFAPVQGRYKVYIIDECHMLSTAAFNALLKTLEEPPAHVVFVLATTDPQRVLPTIISRCQRFDFRRIPLEAMVTHLQAIADQEKIEIAPTAVQRVAQIAQGGMRDAESLLDQLSLLSGLITLERVWDLVGTVPEQDLMRLLEAIASYQPEAVLTQTRQLLNQGREPLVVLQNLAGFYRDLLIAKTAPERQDLVAITPSTWEQLCHFANNLELPAILGGQQHLRTCEAQVKQTTQPRLWLEITLLGLLTIPQDLPPALSQGAATIAAARVPKATHPPIAPSETPSVPVSHPEAADRSLSPDQAPDHSPQPDSEAAETPAAPTGETTSPPLAPANAPAPALSSIWQQLMTHLHPLSQALLSEHGRLLALEEQQAQVGIRSQNLAKIAQSKLPDVEAAFLQLLNRKVKVNLRVISPAEWQTVAGAANLSPPSVDGASSQSDTRLSPSSDLNSRGKPANSGNASNSLPRTTPPSAPTSPGLVDPDNLPETSRPTWTEDEVARAAKSFAQLFNGEIVDLDRDPDSGSSPTSVSIPEAATLALDQELEAEEEDDLPF